MDPKEAAAVLGRKGGKAGTGAAKRRGDSAYYKALRARPRVGKMGRLEAAMPLSEWLVARKLKS